MIIAAYMVTGFLVASVYAWSRLRGRDGVYQRRAMALGLGLGAVFAPIQIVAGDLSAKMVARTQPVKLAAMEGQFRTEAYAPLRIGGLPDEGAGRTRFALEIPGALSWLAHGEPSAVVRGLDSFPATDRPPVAVVHVAFQLMVGAGMALFALSAWSGWSAWRRRALPRGPTFLLAVAAAGPLAILALEAGWIVTEVGRQPWIVQGVMRTADAVTGAPGIGVLFAATLATYALLGTGAVLVLRLLARRPLPTTPLEVASHAA
jgi:cytochrome d ubiquinol oxidase subunit I